MIRLLPFILIPIIVLGGLGYFRYVATRPKLTTPKTEEPIEVPKTLPEASLEDRVKTLEDLAKKLVTQVNSLKSSNTSSSSDSKLNTMDASVTELKARVSALEKATPTPFTSTKSSTVYIPLGSGGGPWADVDWHTTAEYEVSLNSDNYPNYTGMNLEVTFKLAEAAGTGSVRLYNVTDGSATSGQLDTTSSSFSLQSTSSFKLASGTKTYRLQVKSSSGKDLHIQSARIKVNF